MSDLRGKRVVITRPREQAEDFARLLRDAGAQVIFFPTIRIQPAVDPSRLDRALRELDCYHWLVLTSVNGVQAVWQRLEALGIGELPPGLRVAAIGPQTAAALEQRGVHPDFVPGEYIAEAILPGLGDLRGKRVLLARAERARRALSEAITHLGGQADEVTAYHTVPAEPDPHTIEELRAGVDIITFTSSSTVRSFCALVEAAGLDPLHLPGNPLVACIGPITAGTACELGLPVQVVAQEYTTAGLVRALLEVESQKKIQGDPMEMIEPKPNNLQQKCEAAFPRVRPRRLRLNPTLRSMVRETELNPADFIYPVFVRPGMNEQREIPSMPGIYQWSVDRVAEEAERCAQAGVPAVVLFGIPQEKDPMGSENFAPDGVVQRAIREIKRQVPELVVITDVCMCEYTDHGHCGVLNVPDKDGRLPAPHLPEGYVLNDPTLDVLEKVVLSHAEAGADIVAPSGMIDGMVKRIRAALDRAQFEHVGILSYAVKYASAFYGPFRDAAESPPKFGDRKSHQMDPANVREALREAALDVNEGADMLMVKPALPYLDVIRRVHEAFPQLPLAAYNVSGEYSMLKAAAARGWLDERTSVLEALTGIKRAGADLILTYHALEASRWLREG